jgi:drug/metabolite transporter (DMT)-like permease
MNRTTSILVLLVAATLEAGGDALIRVGLQKNAMSQRVLFFVFAAIILFSYGWTVNAPPWDFGKLIGIYVVFFFLIAQAISWVGFKQPPSLAMWIGTALIVAGGIVIFRATA